MERDDFLTKLFSLYAATFNKGNGIAWTEAYKDVLSEDIDYDLLYKFMLTNYAGSSAPSPAYLVKNAVKKPDPFKTENKYPEYENVLADKNGVTYEFGLNCSFQEFIDFRKKDGFTNFRYAKQVERL